MLKVSGNGSITTCDGITRRDFLQVGMLGALGFSLSNLAALQAIGAVVKGKDEQSVIMIFNLGAPSQLDTWDMKPDAPREIRGPFKPIRTNNPDIQISEIFPRHARIADRFSLVRTCYHTAAAVHDTGHQMMQTGRLFTGGVNTPHTGCALEYLKGRRNELPANVILPEVMGPTGGGLPHGQDAGFLGKALDPFVLNADPSKKDFKVPDLLPPSEIGEVRLQRRRELRDIVDQTVGNFEASPNAQLMDSSFAAAYRLMTSAKAREAFDLTNEPEKVRERYGLTRFGQCCLLARRLIEAGVRFVTINTFITVFDEISWDIHGSKPFTSIEGMRDIVAPMYFFFKQKTAYELSSRDWSSDVCSSDLFAALVFSASPGKSQISPGPLAKAHQSLSGTSQCASCHQFGASTPTFKCLECHKEIARLLSENTGYHARLEMKNPNGKECVRCHLDHNGENFSQ